MIIVSQDKTKAFKTGSVQLSGRKIYLTIKSGTRFCMARYKTEERAQEVYAEIEAKIAAKSKLSYVAPKE